MPATEAGIARTMHIGIYGRTWNETGGIGVYTRSLITALTRQSNEHQFTIYHPSNVASVDLPKDNQVVLSSLGDYPKLLTDQWIAPRQAKKDGVDLLFHPKLTIPLLFQGGTAMTVHGTERFVFPENHQGADMVYFKTVYPQFLRRASCILAVSECAKKDIVNYAGIDPDKIAVTYLAADPIFKNIQDATYLTKERARLELPDHFFLFVGHIYPGKNVARLLKAFAQVRKQHDIHLVFAGDLRWNYEEDLELVRSLGIEDRVKFQGHCNQNDLLSMYNLATTTVFPSFYESFGLINVEANACGCPIVTSNTGGSPEAAGDAAIYVDPHQVDDIAMGMLRSLEDTSLRQELAAKGYVNAQRFSWDKAAVKTIDSFTAAMER